MMITIHPQDKAWGGKRGESLRQESVRGILLEITIYIVTPDTRAKMLRR